MVSLNLGQKVQSSFRHISLTAVHRLKDQQKKEYEAGLVVQSPGYPDTVRDVDYDNCWSLQPENL